MHKHYLAMVFAVWLPFSVLAAMAMASPTVAPGVSVSGASPAAFDIALSSR